MTNRHWLKEEVPQWVKEEIITPEAGKKLLSLYKKEDPILYKEAFFMRIVPFRCRTLGRPEPG